MLKQQLQEELKQSMLAKDELKTSVLRMLISAIGYYEIQKGGAGYQADDEDVNLVIQRQTKQRRDSIEQFTAAGRKDLADKEEKELAILKTYMPEQMTEEQVKAEIKKIIAETGAKTPADMGKVMGILVSKLKGQADMTKVSQMIKDILSSPRS